MRILLIVLVVLACVWWWRASRPDHPSRPATKPPPSTEPQDMVRCLHCGMHLPLAEAVQGKAGNYCCPDHRQRAES